MEYVEHDRADRADGVEIVYIHTIKRNSKIVCARWFQGQDSRNKQQFLPGKIQTVNCGLVFTLRECLKQFRKEAELQCREERIPMVYLRTNATYIQTAMDRYIYSWSEQGWRNKRNKSIANHIFWQSVYSEMTRLDELDVGLRVEHIPHLPKIM